MTYRELLKLYKAGELELEQRKKVEKDIERQEAISDYLYEQEDIPEFSDIFGEKTDTKKNSEKDNRKNEEGEERKNKKNIGDRKDKEEKKDGEKLKKVQRIKSKIYKKRNKKNDDIEDVDTEFIKMVNRSIRRAFRRLGLTVLAAAFVLILFVQFCLPTIVSCFYYNPAENIGDKDYAISKMSRDMAVYSEVFLPGKRRGSVQVEAKGYGNYNITVNQTSSFTGNLTDVSGEITRGKLRYYDNNIFRKPATNVFVYGSIVGKEENTVEENLKYTRKYFDVKDDEEINLCAAGSKEQSLETLQELDERKMYIGYVSFAKIMSYVDFKKYVDKQELAEVWCAVQVAELDKEDGGVVNFQSNIPNIGFVCNPSYNTAIKWDDKKYPNLLPGCETQDMGNADEWDDPEENLKSESNARQHFVSLLNYLSDQKKFLAMMEKDNSNYSTEELKEMASYIKKNGIKVYGFTTIADKKTLLKLSKQNEVYEIYTEEVR